MDITFLVGNGFDLSLGYKTSYKDFYKYYIKQPINPEHEGAVSRLKTSIKKDRKRKLWSDFEIGLGKFTQDFGTDQADDFIDACMDANQHLHDYFLSLPNNQNLEYITEKEWTTIRTNICNFYKESTPQDNTEFSNIKRIEEGNGRGATFHFVSFNYTFFLDNYVKKIAQAPLATWKHGSEEKKHVLDPIVFHVHGQMNDFPIIGVSSEDQILNPSFQKNDDVRSALIKADIVSDIGYHRYSEMQEIINKSRIICLLGVSIGDSDKHWWDYINKWLKSDPNRSIFIFEHTSDPPSNVLPQDLHRKRRKVIYRLLNHSSFPDVDKRNLAKRIHVIFNTKKVLVFPSPLNNAKNDFLKYLGMTNNVQ